ncbi:glutaredoxin family protein [Alcanivorax sp. 1008]|uniref:glutaredoxin family protein n=1 Tax=Alcanivorax sp. 1008 TaxID=2816853 RepID=UPI001D41F99D|nr:glutaredoxin family protein [Alcanivorax sp. 1008]MCC1497185.1 glutaredoxin family protein [Alcanivorax sp. 1008]
MQVELLTTMGCHLCEQAQEVISRAAPQAQVVLVDIAEDDGLIQQYGELIPVLRSGGKELRWPFSLLDVRGFLAE